MIKLAVDMMGSDNGPKILSEGVISFLNDKDYKDVNLVLVGDLNELKQFENNERVELVEASKILPMDVGALEAVRMKEASMTKAVSLVKERNLDAVVSAGATGGFISLATIKMKLIDGVERAALVTPFPTKTGKQMVVLDIGANNENNAHHLVQFAKMGRIYTRICMDNNDPQVYLLSNGAEDKKGAPEVKEAHKLLKESNFPSFRGNIEGREALNGDVDVLVTGGYAGNVFLKTAEGVANMMKGLIKDAFKTNLSTKVGYLFAKKGFDNMTKIMDYKKYGGAMLLGINGIAVKAHGSSDGYSFYNALKLASKMARQDVVNKIKEGVKDEIVS